MTLAQRVLRFDWFPRRMARRAGPPIDTSPPVAASFGPGIGNQPSHVDLLRESLGIASVATRAIATRVSGLNPLVMVSRQDGTGTLKDETLDDHPAKLLLDRPHPNFTRKATLRMIAQWLATVGEAYVVKVGNRMNLPSRLDLFPPDRMWPIVRGNVVTAYGYTTPRGDQDTVPADRVIRIAFPDPENMWGAEGYLGPVAVTADAQKFSGQHLKTHYQHDATPKATFETSPDAQAQMTEAQIERFMASWRRSYDSRLGTRVGIPPILPMGYKLVSLAMQSGADATPLLEFWRDEMLLAFGVPRSVLGQVLSGDRSSAETNEWTFDKHTVSDFTDTIADALTFQYAVDFDPSLFVQFEEFVSDDKDFRLREEETDLRSKVRTVNQVREDRGLDPVDWGELPVGTLTDTPYDGSGSGLFEETPDAPPPGDDGPEADLEPDDPDSDRAVRVAWARQMAREKRHIGAFARLTSRVLGRQRKAIIERLHKTELPQRDHARASLSVDDLFDTEEWKGIWRMETDPMREQVYSETMDESLSDFGIQGFVITDEMRLWLEQRGASMVSHVTETTRDLLQRELVQASGAGESVDQIARRVRSVMGDKANRQRARTIARTEVLQATQQAQVQSFQVSGVVRGKVWHTSLDGSVRDTHQGMDGQVRELGEPFTLGDGERADAPGIGANGRGLSAHNAINCRCFVTPVRIDR